MVQRNARPRGRKLRLSAQIGNGFVLARKLFIAVVAPRLRFRVRLAKAQEC